MSGSPRVLELVVVAYGSPAPLEPCLAALGDEHHPIVVDNSSLTETRVAVERHGGTYLDPGRNLGFAAGVNYALRHAHRPDADVLLLNPDAVVSPEAIAALHDRLVADPRAACAAPSQTDPETGEAARVAWPFPSPAGAWIEALGMGSARTRADFLIGAVLLLRAEALTDVGLLDERFFLYAEETDWQLRATRRGWHVLPCQDIVATHVGAGTGGDPWRRETYFHASHERFIRKHYGVAGWQLFRMAAIVGAGIRVALGHGERRQRAAGRLRLYVGGPVKAEGRLTARPAAPPT